ncbi:MAG: hypothetical protein LBJ95_00025 [Oscillospiraceae bacterium]|jgi:ABC-type transport system involved in multi-copper enzyme maturation permease subunit|nr:hypothetical protein [Oscillospiraceae bacterium]
MKSFWILLTLSIFITALDARGVCPGSCMTILGCIEYSGLNTSFFVVLTLVVIFTCSEFSNGTMKNRIFKGCNRISIYLSKITICLCARLFFRIVNIFVFIFMARVNRVTFEFGLISNEFLQHILYNSLYVLTLLSITLTLAMIFKSTTRTIIAACVVFYLLIFAIIFIQKFSGLLIDISNSEILTLAITLCLITLSTAIGIQHFKTSDIK